jgi:hypothetical protein
MATHWYVVKTFYRSIAEGRAEKPDRYCDPEATLLEERSLLIKAPHKTEAIKKAEKEALDYAHKVGYQNHYNQTIRTQYLGLYDIYKVDGSLQDKKEIFFTNRIINKRVSKKKIAHTYIPKKERDLMRSKRKKFVNREFTD